MFVINANNNSQISTYDLSNQFLWLYPDVRNSIIMSRPFLTRFNWDATSNWTTCANINWTKINYWTDNIIFPEYFKWFNWEDKQQVWFLVANGGPWDMSTSKRMWIDVGLWWGEVIWKKIIFWKPLWTMSLNNTAFPATNSTIKYTVQLLHTDWTLTSVWETTFTLTWASSWSSSITVIPEWWGTVGAYYRENVAFSWNELVEWSWVVASEWDIIVCDMSCLLKNTSWSILCFWYYFWYTYTFDKNKRIKPIQISID